MTERFGALTQIVMKPNSAREHTSDAFSRRYAMEPLILDKWFALQAQIPERETLDRVRGLMHHRGFSMSNPNRVRALIGGFTANQTQFNRADGEGFKFLEEIVVGLDPDQSADRRAAPHRDALVALARGDPPRACRGDAEADRRAAVAVAGRSRHRHPQPGVGDRTPEGASARFWRVDARRRFGRRRPVAPRHKNPSRAPSRGLDKDSHKDSYRTDSGIAALPED